MAPRSVRSTSSPRTGLTRRAGVRVHDPFASDQIGALIPWSTLAWREVHQGHLPLWNPYSALGMPLAFNWQSGVFSVPTLVGYLLPVRLAYTGQIVVTLFVAGTGTYFFCRLLRIGVLGAVFAATAFELSGRLVGWLGWPHAAVASWSGWLFAAALLIARQRRRRFWGIALFAVVLACAIYAGQLEILFLLLVAVGLFLVAYFVSAVRAGESAVLVHPAVDLVAGTVLGLGLSAPLWLAGEQVFGSSIRRTSTGAQANGAESLRSAMNVIAPFFFTHSYIGVIVIVMAVVGAVTFFRRAEIAALSVVGVVFIAIVFLPPLVAVLRALPSVGSILWSTRAEVLMAFPWRSSAARGSTPSCCPPHVPGHS